MACGRRAGPALPARRQRARATRPRSSQSPNRLYGGDEQHRLRQEIILGIGGVRALRALGHPSAGVPHERGPRRVPRLGTGPRVGRAGGSRSPRPSRRCAPAACSRLTRPSLPGSTGSRVTSSSGTSRGSHRRLGLTFDELFAIGERADEPDGKFNMAVMGMNLASRRNGVAALHGEVAREMFSGPLARRLDAHETPIGHRSPTASTRAPG